MIKEQDALLTSNIEKSKVSQEPPQLLMNQSDIHFMKNQLKNECKNEQYDGFYSLSYRQDKGHID